MRKIQRFEHEVFSRMNRGLIAFCIFSFTFLHDGYSQSDIPIGSWRLHISYNAIHHVALQGQQKVFGAADHGIVVLDRADNSFSTFSKMNGLNGMSITSIQFDDGTGQLLVSYADGTFDVINASNEIRGFDPTRDALITGSRRINHITIHNSLAYLATDYGVVVFDLNRKQVKETWRDLGVSGQRLPIVQSVIVGDTVLLATTSGVIAGDVRTNLLDYNNWKRFNSGTFSTAIQAITAFGNKPYVAINNNGIYRYDNGVWIKENFLQDVEFNSMRGGSGGMLISGTQKLWRLTLPDVVNEITSPLITSPSFATEDNTGKLWVGDGKSGLVTDAAGSFASVLPNCPANNIVANLSYYDGVLYAQAGGFSNALTALGNDGNVDAFSEGIWSTELLPVGDLTDRIRDGDRTYTSSFGAGIAVKDNQGSVSILDDSNSPLMNINPPGKFVNITSLESTTDGVWVSNYGVSKSLHLLRSDNTWESFAFPLNASRYPLQLLADFENNVWMILNPDQGGGLYVFDQSKNEGAYLTDVTGSGGLPHRSVRSIAMDHDGLIWVGTDLGVAYFVDPLGVFDGNVDAVKPIVDGRFLLRDDKVTAIAVDGGNRKWIGTERGVWLFNSTGEQLIHNFTTDNSPLLSNSIRDIEINAKTGEVFFATTAGLVSFRSDATESSFRLKNVKVFPNPVTTDFSGQVGISGLASDAVVKITDISGKLVRETQANGGTATWDVRDYRGSRVPTGVYIVFTVTADGAEHATSKIAVID